MQSLIPEYNHYDQNTFNKCLDIIRNPAPGRRLSYSKEGLTTISKTSRLVDSVMEWILLQTHSHQEFVDYELLRLMHTGLTEKWATLEVFTSRDTDHPDYQRFWKDLSEEVKYSSSEELRGALQRDIVKKREGLIRLSGLAALIHRVISWIFGFKNHPAPQLSFGETSKEVAFDPDANPLDRMNHFEILVKSLPETMTQEDYAAFFKGFWAQIESDSLFFDNPKAAENRMRDWCQNMKRILTTRLQQLEKPFDQIENLAFIVEMDPQENQSDSDLTKWAQSGLKFARWAARKGCELTLGKETTVAIEIARQGVKHKNPVVAVYGVAAMVVFQSLRAVNSMIDSDFRQAYQSTNG